MRVLLIILWAGAIFIFTCTADFTSLMESGMIQFQWDGQPDPSKLFSPLPAELSPHFLLQKLGHLSAFFILTILLQARFHSKLSTLIIAISYAALTELLQLFFTRDGRLFDIGIDTIGILLAGVGSLIIVRKQEKSL